MSGTAATTRRKRPTKCVVCLRRRRRPGHPTCATCAAATLEAGRVRYRDRVDRGVCPRCEGPPAVIDGRAYRLCARHLKIDRARDKSRSSST